ncbi:hypothetical protein BOTBODRAFT_33377 [Botryobasidium botryosum FD-172 SS1]|uniref:Small ribosomal subunit protein mS35 mitochondrial conserved domain-containing protein n=1 Tax=Botryobasidium botryosum (strain FD-172 SS1) TaxID=930990 RepID=A0A067MD32_BOTB1|nr:hypothetical protein BOTBODRAFT_33377 [Botryobasidium botryosum FD-172 SS1]
MLRWLAIPRAVARSPSSLSPARAFHASVPALIRTPERQEEDPLDLDLVPDFEHDDTTSVGHALLRQRRQYLTYLRLIESEVPKLVAFRKPFTPPPTGSSPLIVRSISYGGELHPAAQKGCLVVALSQLPLSSPAAIHKFKLLAATRWSARTPSDSGLSENEKEDPQGYFKITCENFPQPSQNLKWCSDVLDRMIAEANDPSADSYADIPQDTRHLDARDRKKRKGLHVRGRPTRPTLADFPQDWLPRAPAAAHSTGAPSSPNSVP